MGTRRAARQAEESVAAVIERDGENAVGAYSVNETEEQKAGEAVENPRKGEAAAA